MAVIIDLKPIQQDDGSVVYAMPPEPPKMEWTVYTSSFSIDWSSYAYRTMSSSFDARLANELIGIYEGRR